MSTYTHIDVCPDGNSKTRHWADCRSPDLRAVVPVFPSAFLAGPDLFGPRRRNRPIGKGRSVLAAGLFALGLVVGLAAPTDVEAAIFYPGDGGFLTGFTVTPLTLTASPRNALYSNLSNVDIGAQSPANVETFLESSVGFNTPLTFVSGGACNGTPSCDEADNSATLAVMADVFGVHFDNKFLSFLYPGPISSFNISGLPMGVSNVYAYNTSPVPLPAALPLFLSALAGLSFFGWRRNRAAA